MVRSPSPLPSQSWNGRETLRHFLLLPHPHNLLPTFLRIRHSLGPPNRFFLCGIHFRLLLTSPTLLDQLPPLSQPNLLLLFLSQQHRAFPLPHSHSFDLIFLPSHRHLPPRRTSSSSRRSHRQTQGSFRSREPRRGRGRGRNPEGSEGTQLTDHKTSSSRERPSSLVVAFEGKETRDGHDHQRLPSSKGGRRERSGAEEMDQGRGGNYSLGSEGVYGPGSSRLRLSQSERGRRDGR
ncbi:hypothetical protein BDY24DRAFT_397806 [Mrakia frigida]|uniref:uncharacterized protein n=1 Tax=Mrakia frigida TaxID=29902 RepID=UPI003FCC2353